jgi:predicted regulator of Ras-like GTPase activity (Roadblock/LC7/MglB family)
MASAPAPRYRYREESPETISVPAAELVAHLPQELRVEPGEEGPEGARIHLPCSEILQGNVPRITLGRLAELSSGLVRVPEGRNPSDRINLPPGWIALHFRMVTVREELPPEPVTVSSPAINEPIVTPTPEPAELTARVENPVIVEEPDSARKDSEENKAVEIPEEETSAPLKEQAAAPKKGFFSSLPIFRRTQPAESIPATDPSPAKAGNDAPSPAAKALVTSATALEHLWKLDPKDEIAEGNALQALFMTDEKLTLEKVVSKAGELPGLDACVLAHGDRVICASKAQSGQDLQNLSGQAMTMLSQIRDSSEKMGLGAVPAVTLHADRGVVSFLHHGELCLLVLHAGRGFVPGVRERLQEMMGHLSAARPALPPAKE